MQERLGTEHARGTRNDGRKFFPNIRPVIKEDEMAGECGTFGEEQKC